MFVKYTSNLWMKVVSVLFQMNTSDILLNLWDFVCSIVFKILLLIFLYILIFFFCDFFKFLLKSYIQASWVIVLREGESLFDPKQIMWFSLTFHGKLQRHLTESGCVTAVTDWGDPATVSHSYVWNRIILQHELKHMHTHVQSILSVQSARFLQKRINHAHFNAPKYKLKGQNVKKVKEHNFPEHFIIFLTNSSVCPSSLKFFFQVEKFGIRKHHLLKMNVWMLMANCAVGIIKPASHNIVIWIMCQQMNALEAVLRNPECY